jgi:hypothetical protein
MTRSPSRSLIERTGPPELQTPERLLKALPNRYGFGTAKTQRAPRSSLRGTRNIPLRLLCALRGFAFSKSWWPANQNPETRMGTGTGTVR